MVTAFYGSLSTNSFPLHKIINILVDWELKIINILAYWELNNLIFFVLSVQLMGAPKPSVKKIFKVFFYFTFIDYRIIFPNTQYTLSYLY